VHMEEHASSQRVRVDDGSAWIAVDGRWHQLRRGDSISIPSGAKPGVYNVYDMPLRMTFYYENEKQHPKGLIQWHPGEEQPSADEYATAVRLFHSRVKR